MVQRQVYSEFRDYFNPVQKVPHSYDRFGKVEFGNYKNNTVIANGHKNGSKLLVEFKHGHSRIGPGALNLTKLLRRMNLFRRFLSGDPLPYEGIMREGLHHLEDLDHSYENFVYRKNGNFKITHRKLN